MQLRVFSYGGGTQSTAALVLAAHGKIDFPNFVYADVGIESEARTHAYVVNHAMPFAKAHGINLEIVRRSWKDGRDLTLYQHILSDQFKGVQIPVRLSNGAPARRHCTVDYKIKVLEQWQKARGATSENPAIVGLGISWDELQRMRTNRDDDAHHVVYPLVDMRLTRLDCESIIRRVDLPQPGRSSCFYCPYHTQAEWQRLRHDEPDLFAKAVAMEQHMDAKMRGEGQGGCTMHSKGNLLEITDEHHQLNLLGEQEDTCESGYCMV